MGNYKFKFSNMMPNAWFYKLKYMTKTKSQNSMKKPTKKKQKSKTKSPSPPSAAASPQQPDLCHQRKSYHFTRDLTANPPTPDNNSVSHFSDPPRKSSKKRRSIKKNRAANRESLRQLVSSSSASADCSCRASLESVWTKPDSTPEDYPNYHVDSCSSANDDDSLFPELGSENGQDSFDDKVVSRSSSCHCGVKSDIICETTNNVKGEKLGEYDLVSHFELPPIITKTDKNEKNEATTEIRSFARVEERNLRIISNSSKEQRIINNPARKLSVNNSQGVKLRTNSPRIASKRFVQVYGRKSVSSGSSGGGSRRSLSESFAVVKSSQDPQRDFKESMCEMIMEYDIRTSKDLEDLLACYLSLNSDKYHGLIIKVFKQIWFEITDN